MPTYTFYDAAGRVAIRLICSADEIAQNAAHYPGLSYIEGDVNANTHDIIGGVPTPHNRGSVVEQLMQRMQSA